MQLQFSFGYTWDDCDLGVGHAPLDVATDLQDCHTLLRTGLLFRFLHQFSNLEKLDLGFDVCMHAVAPTQFSDVIPTEALSCLKSVTFRRFRFESRAMTQFLKHAPNLLTCHLDGMCLDRAESWVEFIDKVRDLGHPWSTFLIDGGMKARTEEDVDNVDLKWMPLVYVGPDDPDVMDPAHIEQYLQGKTTELPEGVISQMMLA